MSHVLWNFMFKGIRVSAHLGTEATEEQLFVSFWQYFPHSSDCFPHSFSSQEFGKTSLWNKYHSLLCDIWKFVGKSHHSCKFLGHSRPDGLSWPKNLHSLWVFSSLIFPRSRSREMINSWCHCFWVTVVWWSPTYCYEIMTSGTQMFLSRLGPNQGGRRRWGYRPTNILEIFYSNNDVIEMMTSSSLMVAPPKVFCRRPPWAQHLCFWRHCFKATVTSLELWNNASETYVNVSQ